jgi:hypothetical protein
MKRERKGGKEERRERNRRWMSKYEVIKKNTSILVRVDG